MKKVFLIFSWVFICNLTLLISLTWLFQGLFVKNQTPLFQTSFDRGLINTYQMYISIPSVLGTYTQSIKADDSRPVIITNYLKSRNKAMGSEYGEYIVEIADHYEVDPYLIVAIAECESNLGENVPEGSNNPFGYGIPTGASSGTEFNTFKHAIEAEVILIRKYMDKGLKTPEEIGPVYAPPSALNGGSWAKCVNFFLEKLR